MTVRPHICPQCLLRLERAARFCPRCGLPVTADDGAALELRIAGHDIVVRNRLAFGDVANLYNCMIRTLRREGIFKVARTTESNRHVAREADLLHRLHQRDAAQRLAPFIPRVVASASYAASGPAQQANVLVYHEGIESIGSLYSLEEVKQAYPDGIDPRDMAWMWRRLLTVLAYVHEQGVCHTAVAPSHVLIEPRDHKLVLVGWCNAVLAAQPIALTPGRWREWDRRDTLATPARDIAWAAQSMSYLLGSAPEPAIARHLQRAADGNTDAQQLLNDFDRTIEALWGPRRFREFVMPPRS